MSCKLPYTQGLLKPVTPPFVFQEYVGRARPVMKEYQNDIKEKEKKFLKKKAPSEPWEASYAEFGSYWPGLGGRSYWNYYFTSRDFHSIQTGCLADFTLRGTRRVFFKMIELLYPVKMILLCPYIVSFILYGRGCVQGMIFITDVRFQIEPSMLYGNKLI